MVSLRSLLRFVMLMRLEAFKKWLAEQGSAPRQDVIDATITYHLLHGGFPTVLFTSKPQFVPSAMTTTAFANVTTGQAVELISSGKTSQLITGSKTVSTITSPVSHSTRLRHILVLNIQDIVCTGGLIHVIDTVLSIPQGLVSVITQSNLTFFIGKPSL